MTITAATTLSSLPSTPTRQAERTAAAPAAAGFADVLARVEAQEAAAPIQGKGGQSGRLSELQQFEGFVLRTFVESMLPKENSSFFGTGTAGEIWRSMLAERVGEKFAAAGGIGLVDLLAGTGTGQAVRQAADKLTSAGDAQFGTAASATRAP